MTNAAIHKNIVNRTQNSVKFPIILTHHQWFGLDKIDFSANILPTFKQAILHFPKT